MKKLFELFSRLMPVWVVLFGVIGFYFPAPVLIFKPYFEWMFFLTMIGIGAVLNFSEFIPIIKKPHTVFLGIFAQFLIMPSLAFLIGHILNLSVPLRLGLILAGCVPGAMASNIIAYLAKTDVAYSIAITSTATLLSPILTPVLTYLYAHTIIEVPFLKMFLLIIKIVILPLCIGFILRRFYRGKINNISYVFPAFSTVFIALICAVVVAANRESLLKVSFVVFVAVFILNSSGLLLGYFAGVLYRFDQRRRRTLAIEVGMQNAGLGALLALKLFSDETAIVPAIFATWCVITASILAEIWSFRANGGVQGCK